MFIKIAAAGLLGVGTIHGDQTQLFRVAQATTALHQSRTQRCGDVPLRLRTTISRPPYGTNAAKRTVHCPFIFLPARRPGCHFPEELKRKNSTAWDSRTAELPSRIKDFKTYRNAGALHPRRATGLPRHSGAPQTAAESAARFADRLANCAGELWRQERTALGWRYLVLDGSRWSCNTRG
jgi:hypothetical protein